MRHLIVFILLFFVSTIAQPNQRLPSQLDKALRKAGIPQSAVSIYALNLPKEKVALDFQSKKQLNPASVMKLVTTLAALEILGPNYRWVTDVYASGKLNSETLYGDLIFKGYGDPSLNLESFWMLLNKIRSRGIRQIKGNIVLDRSYFKLPFHDPAVFDGKPHRPYNLGPDALMVNFRSSQITFVPDQKARKINTYVVPHLPQLQIINKLRLSNKTCWHWPDTPKVEGKKVTFLGSFSRRCGQRQRYYTFLSADEYFSNIFNKLWTDLGGSLDGKVIPGLVKNSDQLLLRHSSDPLANIIKNVNKFSSNPMARQVYLTLGSNNNKKNTGFSPANAEKELKLWLQTIGITGAELTIENGSGLSRNSRISAFNLGKILKHAWHSPLMPEFVSTLPILSVDGTLRKRLHHSPLSGKGHFKTGYVKGVRSIAGYLTNKRAQKILIVCLVNHPKAKKSWPIHEEVLKWAYYNT